MALIGIGIGHCANPDPVKADPQPSVAQPAEEKPAEKLTDTKPQDPSVAPTPAKVKSGR